MTNTVLSRKLPRFDELGRTPLTLDLSQPVRLALWVQDGRVCAFVNGEKRVDVNQVELPPIDRVELRTDLGGAGLSVGYRSVKFAESAPDFSEVIVASGRYVSHGIPAQVKHSPLDGQPTAPLRLPVAKDCCLREHPNLEPLSQ